MLEKRSYKEIKELKKGALKSKRPLLSFANRALMHKGLHPLDATHFYKYFGSKKNVAKLFGVGNVASTESHKKILHRHYITVKGLPLTNYQICDSLYDPSKESDFFTHLRVNISCFSIFFAFLSFFYHFVFQCSFGC